MKLDKQHLQYITNIVDIAEKLGIEEVIIEPDKVRAIDPNRQVFILHESNVPSFPFGSIGIGRLDVFRNRINTMASFGDIDIDVTVNENTDQPFARSLDIKAKKTKVGFRCNDPETIKAPKAYRGEWLCHLSITNEVVDVITKAKKAMKSGEVTIAYGDGVVTFSVKDASCGDSFNYEASTTVVPLTDLDSFTYTYPIDLLTQFLKQNETDIEVKISTKGIINVLFNNINIFLFPRS